MIATRALIFACIATAFLPGTSVAQEARNPSHMVDTYGNSIVTRSETEVCVRRSEWTPARVGASCDPVLAKAEAPAFTMAGAAPPSRKRTAAPEHQYQPSAPANPR
jgi:hypothetical protein